MRMCFKTMHAQNVCTPASLHVCASKNRSANVLQKMANELHAYQSTGMNSVRVGVSLTHEAFVVVSSDRSNALGVSSYTNRCLSMLRSCLIPCGRTVLANTLISCYILIYACTSPRARAHTRAHNKIDRYVG